MVAFVGRVMISDNLGGGFTCQQRAATWQLSVELEARLSKPALNAKPSGWAGDVIQVFR